MRPYDYDRMTSRHVSGIDFGADDTAAKVLIANEAAKQAQAGANSNAGLFIVGGLVVAGLLMSTMR